MAPPASIDTVENRAYAQLHKIWIMGDYAVMSVMKRKPDAPLDGMYAALQNFKTNPKTSSPDMPSQDLASQAADYLAKHDLAVVTNKWYAALLEAKPENPMDFSLSYFEALGAKPEAEEGEDAKSDAAADDQKGGVPNDDE